ncbi:MAG: hypothetical protein ACJ74O_13665 [Frankiaceae bacterium]
MPDPFDLTRETGHLPLSLLAVIDEESVRAHHKHGATSMTGAGNTDLDRLPILVEEAGEVARLFNDARHDGVPVDDAKLLGELIQTAAMAAGWAQIVATRAGLTAGAPTAEATHA